jgi:hypothetical protein
MKAALLFLLFLSFDSSDWLTLKRNQFVLNYAQADAARAKEYAVLVENGIQSCQKFFAASFKNNFDVFVHPDRASMERQWQKDWGMPDFKSECWMVASGVAAKLDLLSPLVWKSQACEHQFENQEETQRLITHELVHVFHGQNNPSPDFGNTQGIDWLVEGLAVYASGQGDEDRMAKVRSAVMEGNYPKQLEKFWTGNLKYGYAGSMVFYIDKTYGREKLIAMMKLTKLPEVLTLLAVDEESLISSWKNFILKTH